MQAIRNRQIDQQTLFDRLMEMAKLDEGKRQFNDELAYNKSKPQDMTMDELDLLAVQKYQAGDRSPAVMQRLNARAAMEGMKTQYSQDKLGRLTPVTAPNAYSVLLSGAGMGGGSIDEGGDDVMPPQPLPMGADSGGAGDMLYDLAGTPENSLPSPDRPLTPQEWEQMAWTGEEPPEALPQSTNPGDALKEASGAEGTPYAQAEEFSSGLDTNETANKRRQDRIAVLEEAGKKMPEALIMLRRAQELNDQSYGGAAAIAGPAYNKWVKGTLDQPSDEKADNTTELDNLLKGAGMATIKDYVGSQAISDGDRKSVLELQGAVDMNPDSRQRIIDKNYEAAQRAIRINELERAALASGRDWTAEDSRRVYRQEFGIDFDTGEKIGKDGKKSPMSKYKEGDTATNQQTGERVIFRNGRWVPFNG